MRYALVIGRQPAGPVFSAPWLWLATLTGNLVAFRWPDCSVTDTRSGAVLRVWSAGAALSRPSAAAFEHISVQPDESTHTRYFGTTAYGKGHAPAGGAQPGDDHRARGRATGALQ